MYIREGEKVWTINIELAHLYLGINGTIGFEFGLEFAHIDALDIIEVIPKINGTVEFNIAKIDEYGSGQGLTLEGFKAIFNQPAEK